MPNANYAQPAETRPDPQSILRCQISFGMVYSVVPNDQKPTKILQFDKFSDFGDPSSPPSH